jgi:hyperosmotically inducible periplasmic protein
MRLSIFPIASMLIGTPVGGSAATQSTTTTQSATTTSQSDEALDSTIRTRIASHPTLTADAIKVGANSGIAALSGMVATEADKAKAERLANVPGIKRVENNLVSREKEKDKATGTAGTVVDKTKEGAAKTGETVTDGWITTRIKTKFMGEEALRESDIKVDTDNLVVTLTGTTASEAARAKAVAMAKEVEGVKKVVDKLTVAPKG